MGRLGADRLAAGPRKGLCFPVPCGHLTRSLSRHGGVYREAGSGPSSGGGVGGLREVIGGGAESECLVRAAVEKVGDSLPPGEIEPAQTLSLAELLAHEGDSGPVH